MNLAIGTLAAVVATAVPPPAAERTATADPPPAALEYAVPPPPVRCVAAPCGAVRVTDLGLDLGEPGGPRAGEVRLLIGDRFYLGTRVGDQTRTLALATARWDLALDHRDQRTSLTTEYRGARARVRARAEEADRETATGRRLEVEAAVRLGPALEILVAGLDDDRSGFAPGVATRPTSQVSLGALWQHGARFELQARLLAGTLASPAGLELDRRGLDVDAVYQAASWRLGAALGVEEISGRFDRHEATVDLRFDWRFLGHLVAHAEGRERHEVDLGSIERDLGAGVTYYARRFRFARGGEAGRAVVALIRRARELGFNERQVHDLAGRRRLRERLALASRDDQLAELADRLYRAQIDERNVPVAGVLWRRDRDNLDGSRLRQRELFVAIPWPRRGGPHPLRPDEAATDFLRFTWVDSERRVSSGFTTRGSLLALDVTLRRELGLRLEWSDPPATGLQFALQSQEPRQFSAQLSYRLGI